MAKTLISICFTTLLLVVLLISAEIPKSEAQQCDNFIGEGPEGTVSNPCKANECSASCKVLFPTSCGGKCEIHDNEDHCHCYGLEKCDNFLGEGPEGTVSNPCKANECSASCKVLFPTSCGGKCEIHDNEDHCHCYGLEKCDNFLGEGPEGTVSNPCKANECSASCKVLFPTSCGGKCEIHDNEDHCHCYGLEKCDNFLGEGPEGTVSNPCKANECSASCKVLFPTSCGGKCEIHDNEDHCHCFGY